MRTVTKLIASSTINALVRDIKKLTTETGCGRPYQRHVQAEFILWPIADLRRSFTNVRFWGQSGHQMALRDLKHSRQIRTPRTELVSHIAREFDWLVM